jgi:hypothetical protein
MELQRNPSKLNERPEPIGRDPFSGSVLLPNDKALPTISTLCISQPSLDFSTTTFPLSSLSQSPTCLSTSPSSTGSTSRPQPPSHPLPRSPQHPHGRSAPTTLATTAATTCRTDTRNGIPLNPPLSRTPPSGVRPTRWTGRVTTCRTSILALF